MLFRSSESFTTRYVVLPLPSQEADFLNSQTQPSVLATILGPEADIRKKHVATYETALDVSVYVHRPVDRKKLAELGPGIKRRVEEVTVGSEESEKELDDWGMPPSAQRRRD